MANSNPFDAMARFYEKCVKERDKKGFAEAYVNATNILFECIKKELDMDLHFEDVEYLDGYYIFGRGTNSVVHFHVKEAPGWKGGIWWEPAPTEKTKNRKHPQYETEFLECRMFFQFEKEIDKFKPTASQFGGKMFKFWFGKEGTSESEFLNTCWDLRFIIKEPYLAFYKDMHYSNFNHEHVTRETAKRYWNTHWKKRAKEKEIDQLNADEMFETLKYIVGPAVEKGFAYIVDCGPDISPRYDIVLENVLLENGQSWVEKPGLYYLFDGYTDAKKDERLYKKTKRACAKREGWANFDYFYNPFSDFCYILDKKDFKKLLREKIKADKVLYYKKKDGTIYEGPVKTRWAED